MSEAIQNVQLKFSCPASWDDMQPVAGGRHCTSCEKKVYDFTNSKAEEFQRILAENDHNVCGRFTREQMHAQPVALPFWKKWLAAALVLLGINYWGNKAVAQHIKHKAVKHSKKVDSSKIVTCVAGEVDVKTISASTLESAYKIKMTPSTKLSRTPDTVEYVNGIVGAEVYPIFPGGTQAWNLYLQKQLNNLKIVKKGKIVISFTVEKDGKVTHAKLIKGISKEMDEKALHAVSASPRWKPGTIDGKPVQVEHTVPIVF